MINRALRRYCGMGNKDAGLPVELIQSVSYSNKAIWSARDHNSVCAAHDNQNMRYQR